MHILILYTNTIHQCQYIGLPIVFHFLPKKVNLNLEMGKPISFNRKLKDAPINDDEINEYHRQFIDAMEKLFDNTKSKYGIEKDTKLQILG